MEYLAEKFGVTGRFAVTEVHGDTETFLNAVMEFGLRVMIDPVRVTEHHTKWTEVVRAEPQSRGSGKSRAGGALREMG